MLKAAYVLDSAAYDLIYGPAQRQAIAGMVDVLPQPITDVRSASPDVLAGLDIILSGWGAPKLDAALLARLPNLRAVFYGAGSIRGIVSDAFWERSILITSSYAGNAIPVAELTLAEILFSLKRGWQHVFTARAEKRFLQTTVPGAFGSTVGLVSLGMIGRRVAQLLSPFDIEVVAFDPMLKANQADTLGVTPVSLEQLFAQSDVVSLHTPWLPETEKMITGDLIRSMKPGATLLNTSRGAVIDEAGMIAALRDRPDVWAVLDVTHPEPPPAESALWAMPNVVLTPHIAGSHDKECQRMGELVVEEVRRFVKGEPPRFAISREQSATMA